MRKDVDMLYEEMINGYRVYFSEGKWFVEDAYGATPYDSFDEAASAAIDG